MREEAKHMCRYTSPYVSRRARVRLLFGKGRIGALRTRRNFVVLTESHVGAAIGATVSAVAGLFAGVIIFHILSSFLFDKRIFDAFCNFIHIRRQSKQEITVPAKVAMREMAMAPLYLFTRPPP